MSKRIRKITKSLKEIGNIQVTDWTFDDFIKKDIRDLEFSKSLKRLGSVQVLDWDFKDVLPAVNRIAQTEVDIVDLLKRAADYKVIDWDFRSGSETESSDGLDQSRAAEDDCLSAEEMQALIMRLKNFLQFVVVNLIDEPNHAHVKIAEIAPNVLRVKLIMIQRDVSMLIGTGGFTASAIRDIIQAVAAEKGVKVLLRILTHEEDASQIDAGSAKSSK